MLVGGKPPQGTYPPTVPSNTWFLPRFSRLFCMGPLCKNFAQKFFETVFWYRIRLKELLRQITTMPVIQGKKPTRPRRHPQHRPRIPGTPADERTQKRPRLEDLLWKLERMVSQYGETGRLGDEERVGSGKLSLLPPSLGGDPSLEDLLQGEADPLEEAWRLKWELPLDRGRHTWSRNYDEVKRNPPPKPPHMNEGGIASLLSNGGSEAMMLELEGDAAALPGDLFSGEPDPRWLSHPEDEGYLPEARIRRQLQRKAGSQIGEWLEDLTGMFDMQETYEEE